MINKRSITSAVRTVLPAVACAVSLQLVWAGSAGAALIVGAPTVDANGVQSYPVTSVYQGSQQQIVRVLEPTNPAPGRPRRLLYVLPVEAGVTDQSSQFGDGLEELRLLDVPDRFNMTLIAPSFGYEPWYGDNVTDQTMWMETFIISDLVPWGDGFLPAGPPPQRFVLGFSKSGNGALFLIFRHPDVFSAAAAWDSPAQLNDINAFPALVLNFGTQANYDLYFIPMLVTADAQPFTSSNRLWISGDQSAWTADMDELHSQLTAAGIPHTWVAGGERVHSWSSGWLDGAVTSLDANAASTSTTSTTSTSASTSISTTRQSTTTTSASTTTTLPPPCGSAPATGCRLAQARASSVQIKSNATNDQFKWKWTKGAATDVSDFMDPVGGSATYRVCVYDNSANSQPLAQMDVPPGGTCGTAPCWKATGSTGFAYKNKAATPNGLSVVKLKAGIAGRANVQARGKGANLPTPTLGLTLPVTVQLVIANGPTTECWQTTYTATTLNNSYLFKARGP